MTDVLRSYAAVLFDFDGTLADSFGAIASSVNHVRERHGLPALTTEEVKKFVGYGAEYLLTNTVPGGNVDEDMQAYRAHHPSVIAALTHFLPGAAELLPALRHAGKKIGLCSNKPRAFSEKLLRHLGVANLFDVVLGPEDVAWPKPSPDMLLLALTRLALPKEAVLYIGDMTVDIQTARAAGVHVWTVATGTQSHAVLQEAGPDRLLNNLHEILAEL